MNKLTNRIKIDFRTSEPLFLQIARQIEELVRNQELKVGDQLPTVRELALELRINFNTVARAYRLLDESHLISTQRGRGTYIWEEPPENVAEELRMKSLQEITRKFLTEVVKMGYTAEQALQALAQEIKNGEMKETGEAQNG